MRAGGMPSSSCRASPWRRWSSWLRTSTAQQLSYVGNSVHCCPAKDRVAKGGGEGRERREFVCASVCDGNNQLHRHKTTPAQREEEMQRPIHLALSKLNGVALSNLRLCAVCELQLTSPSKRRWSRIRAAIRMKALTHMAFRCAPPSGPLPLCCWFFHSLTDTHTYTHTALPSCVRHRSVTDAATPTTSSLAVWRSVA